VLNKTTPDFLSDLQGAGEAFEDMKQTNLSGEKPLGEAKTKAPNSDYHKDEPTVAARQAEVARDYLKRGEDRRAQRPPAGLRRAYGHRAQEAQRRPGAGLRGGRVRRDAGGREPHL